MNRKKIFSRFVIVTVMLVFVIGAVPMNAAVVPNSQSATNTGLGAAEYRVGQMGDAISNVGRSAVDMAGDAFSAVSDAFQGAFDNFEDGFNPTSHVVNENGYYSQTYSNASGRNASIYVDKNNKAYSVNYPIYDAWDTVGGIEKTGYPIADAYEVDNEYYQNFTNGYVRYADDNNVSFVPSKRVNERGMEMTDNTASRARDNANSSSSNDVPFRKTNDNAVKNNNMANNNGDTSARNTDHQKLSGTGADASGRAGSLESTSGARPLMSIVGIVILAAVVILLVSLSVAASKNNG